MPSPIYPKPSDEDTSGTIAERVLGRDAKQRQTKTWIPSTTLINRFGLLRNHSTRLTAMFRVVATNEAIRLHVTPDAKTHRFNRDTQHCACGWTPPNVTDKDLAARFTSIASYQGLHQELVEHLGSYKGFLVRTAFGRNDDGSGPSSTPSSAGAAAPAPPANPPPATPPVPPTPNANGMVMR